MTIQNLYSLLRYMRKCNTFKDVRAIYNENEEPRGLALSMNKSQLNDFGVDTNNEQIRTYAANMPDVYAARTINIKRDKGQRSDIVTLKDTGKYQKTFRTKAKSDGLQFTANSQKGKDDIANWVQIDNVLGLTSDNLRRLNFVLRSLLIRKYREGLKNAVIL